ncbi:hypothetical protein [Enhygromyxa salina]|uniref:Uncharacterized protein n=1 Tax=Enhygromyxa salina TaxID=215803 RepID=A0A2S9YN30_9BACT|nr:hypothetical protein [Enhygromyxa salina]PRQ06493.1 hypothetical protein ENSA7_38120 [Enhygromyxa salina]
MLIKIGRALRDVQVDMRTITCDYQRTDTTQTLREGLDEYHVDGGVYDAGDMTEASAQWFRSHDATHVLFGCNTTPEQEALTSTWTMFGTDWQVADFIAEGTRPDQRSRLMGEIVGGVGYGRMTFLVFATLPGVIEVARRARAMRRKWIIGDYERYLDVPLDEIRRDYHIQVYQRPN